QWFTPSWAYHTRCKCLNTSATCRAYHHASLTALLMLSLSPFRPFITFKPKHGKSCNEHRHHEFLRAQPRQLKELCQWRHIQNRKQQYQSQPDHDGKQDVFVLKTVDNAVVKGSIDPALQDIGKDKGGKYHGSCLFFIGSILQRKLINQQYPQGDGQALDNADGQFFPV